jgi:putative tryptophan/tyrosine transport system substrate-binding protein
VRRRNALGLVMMPLAATRAVAQGTAAARLGVLGAYGPTVPLVAPFWTAFYGELALRGWREGQNLEAVGRYGENRPERDAALAQELVAAQPQAILATSSSAVEALMRATRTIPIVMWGVSHAVEAGFVQSMARPGGNVTGVTNQAGDLQAKFVELLRSVRPGLQRLGIVWSPANRGSALAAQDMKAAAEAAGLRSVSLPVDQTAQVESALATAVAEGVQALQVHPTPAIAGGWRRIKDWALAQRVATLGQALWVREGFLMSYWANPHDLARMAAAQTDRILRGAKPADLPVQQPTRFDLVLNLKTARAIGATIPASLKLLAEEIIE